MNQEVYRRISRFRPLVWLAVLLASGSLAAPLTGAVLDYSAQLETITVIPAGGTVTYRVFDPALGSEVADSDSTGNIFGLRSANGVVAWNNGSTVYCRIYDPNLGFWVKTNIVSSAPGIPVSSQGVVAWTSGNFVFHSVYDAARQVWVLHQVVSVGSTFDLRTANGLVTWSSGTVVYYSAYDPVTGTWNTEAVSHRTGSIFTDLQTRDGVVAWSGTDFSGFRFVYFRVYDPTRGGWVRQAINIGGGNTFDLTTRDGVVAFSVSSVVGTQVYDPLLGEWRGSNLLPSGQVINLRVLNGSVFWTAGGINRTIGYNITNGVWNLPLTAPYASFGVSTNMGNAPLGVHFFDMSLGASSWTWNFGDATAPTGRRSPFHQYQVFASNQVTLSVTGPAGPVAVTNQVILSDVEAPQGTVVINNGDASTTNALVQLTLDATDNSGVVASMRFSNDNMTWSLWEPYAIQKFWMTPAGTATNTVYAQFRDGTGNVSPTASDDIFVDTAQPPLILFSFNSYPVLEATNAFPVEVRLSRSFSRMVEVDLTAFSGSAVAGSDFHPLATRLSFAPGLTNQILHVTILNDNAVELTESFTLALTNPTNGVAGPAATVTIEDDDPAAFSFASAQTFISEAGSFATILVRLNDAGSRQVQVDYATTPGTATEDQDYAATSGRLTFPPGQTVATFTVPILQDAEDEPDETVLMTLTGVTNAIPGSPATATLIIQDDDPPSAGFSAPSYRSAENTGSVLIEVILSTPFDQTVFVSYATTNGSAVAGSDFFPVTGTLTFPPGQTNQFFFVTLLNDSQAENEESLTVRLSGFVNATPGPRTAAAVFIDDDDAPRLVQPMVTPQGWFQAIVQGPPGQSVQIQGSGDFMTWTTVTNLVNQSGATPFLDTGAVTNRLRYYRALLP